MATKFIVVTKQWTGQFLTALNSRCGTADPSFCRLRKYVMHARTISRSVNKFGNVIDRGLGQVIPVLDPTVGRGHVGISLILASRN